MKLPALDPRLSQVSKPAIGSWPPPFFSPPLRHKQASPPSQRCWTAVTLLRTRIQYRQIGLTVQYPMVLSVASPSPAQPQSIQTFRP